VRKTAKAILRAEMLDKSKNVGVEALAGKPSSTTKTLE